MLNIVFDQIQMYAEVVRYVETMYSFREVKSKCGQTDVDGGSVLCDSCCELADNMERRNYV